MRRISYEIIPLFDCDTIASDYIRSEQWELRVVVENVAGVFIHRNIPGVELARRLLNKLLGPYMMSKCHYYLNQLS